MDSAGKVRRYDSSAGGLGLPTAGNINTAVATSNVNHVFDAVTPVVLGGSKTVNSLILAPTSSSSGVPGVLNLNGNTLTLDTGGLGTAEYVKITNGSLAANGNELLVYSNRQLELDSVVSGGSTNLVVGSGTVNLTGTNTFGGGLYINGGTVYVPDDNAILNTSGIHIAGGTLDASRDALTKNVYFSEAGGSIYGGMFNTAGQLRGTGWVNTTTNSAVSISAANPDLNVIFHVNGGGGWLSAGAAGALGSSEVLVNDEGRGASFAYDASDITSNPRGVTVFAEGKAIINRALTNSDIITVKAFGAIQGYDERLATLDYLAGNLTLEEGAVIYKFDNAPTPGISNLPNLPSGTSTPTRCRLDSWWARAHRGRAWRA